MPTKTAYRQALLELTGGGVYATTSAGNVGGTTLICSTFKNTSLPPDHLAYGWIYVASATAPKQRQVTAAGLDAATGTIAVNDAFGSQIGTTTAFEFSPRAPLIDSGAKIPGPMSLDQDIAWGLRYLLAEDEIPVTITTSDEISLATWQAWLDRDGRLVAVLEPTMVSGRAAIDASWRVRRNEAGGLLTLDAELPKLRLDEPFSTATGNLTLKVLRPADTWIKASGGSWAEDADGLSAEGDEAKVDLVHATTAGLVFYYQSLARSRSGPKAAEYQALYEQALAMARALPFWDHTRDDLLPRPGTERTQEAAA